VEVGESTPYLLVPGYQESEVQELITREGTGNWISTHFYATRIWVFGVFVTNFTPLVYTTTQVSRIFHVLPKIYSSETSIAIPRKRLYYFTVTCKQVTGIVVFVQAYW